MVWLAFYGCINWSLTQAQQQSSLDLSQSFPAMKGGKARPKTGFHSSVQKRHVSGSSGASLAKRPHLESWTVAHQIGRESTSSSVSASSTDSMKKGSHGGWLPDVLQSTTSSLSSSVVQVAMLPQFLFQWRSITSNRFVFNMAKGHHLQHRSPPPLFHNFKWFNIKAAAAHHPIIQKEVDELFSKGAIQPSSSGAGFYSSVFVVPKHTGGLCCILNLKQFNCYMHIPTSKMLTIWHVQQLIQYAFYDFSIDLKDAYLHIHIIKHHHHFYNLFGKIHFNRGGFYLLGLPQLLGFSPPLLNLSCSFADVSDSISLSI